MAKHCVTQWHRGLGVGKKMNCVKESAQTYEADRTSSRCEQENWIRCCSAWRTRDSLTCGRPPERETGMDCLALAPETHTYAHQCHQFRKLSSQLRQSGSNHPDRLQLLWLFSPSEAS